MNRPRRSIPPMLLLGIIGMITTLVLLVIPEASHNSQPISHDGNVARGQPIILANENTSGKLKTSRQTTIVSCFFDLSRIGQETKHPPDFYLSTGKDGVLSFDTPLVFFTDSPDAVKKARAAVKSPMHIITIDIRELEVAKAHMERINELTSRDSEARQAGYSGLLFTIYHAKPEMMAVAAKLNPFNTEKFLWMDVGAVRDWGGIVAKDYIGKQFPNPEREWLLGRDGHIMMQGVAGRNGPCEKSVRWVEAESPEHVKDPLSKVDDPLSVHAQPFYWWIAGAIWGGRGDDLADYEKLYRKHLARYLAQDNLRDYSLIDQYLMGALACHWNKIEVVRPPKPCCVDRVNRMWFFLLLFLKDKEYPQQPYTEQELKDRNYQVRGCTYCKNSFGL